LRNSDDIRGLKSLDRAQLLKIVDREMGRIDPGYAYRRLGGYDGYGDRAGGGSDYPNHRQGPGDLKGSGGGREGAGGAAADSGVVPPPSSGFASTPQGTKGRNAYSGCDKRAL
jgi:hypothetical protein